MAGIAIPMRVGDIEILVETTPIVGSEPTSRLDDASANVQASFARAQEVIVEMGQRTVDALSRAGRGAASPTTVEVEFGLKFSAKGNVIMAEASGEASLKVKLVYERPATATGNAVEE